MTLADVSRQEFALRVRGKIKRTAIRAPLLKPLFERNYQAQLGRHADKLPWIPRDRFDIVAELRENGLAVRNGLNLLPASVVCAADLFADHLRADTSLHKPTIEVEPDQLATEPCIYKWGLTDENLDLAEYYIGLPVRYLGVGIKREFADGVAAHTRQWHRDIEDRRMLKIIFYMSDVEDGCGPFEYMNLRASDEATATLGYSSGFVPDADMARLIDGKNWIRVTAPRMTAIFVDPSRIFHRAQAPTLTDRYSMTFTYSSTTPLQTFPYMSHKMLSRLRSDLSNRQKHAVARG